MQIEADIQVMFQRKEARYYTCSLWGIATIALSAQEWKEFLEINDREDAFQFLQDHGIHRSDPWVEMIHDADIQDADEYDSEWVEPAESFRVFMNSKDQIKLSKELEQLELPGLGET